MHKTQQVAGYAGKLFMSPAEVAAELRVSTSTVLRLIHAEKLPAIAVSERIYRIPAASFEMFKAGTLRTPGGLAPIGPLMERPRFGADERLPEPGPEVEAASGGRRAR